MNNKMNVRKQVTPLIIAILLLAISLYRVSASTEEILVTDEFDFQDFDIWYFEKNSAGAGHTFNDGIISLNGGYSTGGGASLRSRSSFPITEGEEKFVFETRIKRDESSVSEPSGGSWGFLTFFCDPYYGAAQFAWLRPGNPHYPPGGLIASLSDGETQGFQFAPIPGIDVTTWHVYLIEYDGKEAVYTIDGEEKAILSQDFDNCPFYAWVTQGSKGYDHTTEVDYVLLSASPINHTPIADAGGPYSGDEGSPFGLFGATAYDPDNDPLTFSWTVDNPVLCSFDDASALNPNLTCNDDGTFVATLSVSDDTENVSSDTSVAVNNVTPTAVFNTPGIVDEGSPITLSLVSAYDPSSADTSAGFEYAFDCGDGSGYGSYGSVNSAACPTDDNGIRSVKGKIRDKDGGETEYTDAVTVNNVAPTINTVTAPDDPVSYCEQPIRVEVTFSDPGVTDTYNVTWDWGDGTSTTQLGVSSPSSQSHTYNEWSIYTVQVIITDDDGGTATQNFDITIWGPTDIIQDTLVQLEEFIETHGDPEVDKVEDVVAKLEVVLEELGKSPPDNQAAVGNIEGAIGDLEALSGFESTMDNLACVARTLAEKAIDQAEAVGGASDVLQDAQDYLAEGDSYRTERKYKDATNKYKDALSKAEGEL